MRKIGFLLTALLTCYMAGVFRSLPLMVLAGMEGVFFLVSFFLCRYLRRGLSAEVLRHGEITEKDRWLVCNIRVRNTGRLPVSRFCIRIRYGYGQEEKERKSRGKRNRYHVKQICGSADRGENTYRLELACRYCGLVTVQMVSLQVYDYLSLFSAARKLTETVEVAVCPQERVLYMRQSFIGQGEDFPVSEQRILRRGETGHEVRQLREYEAGDSSRSIHWNQSARTGQLWVKEYEKESDGAAELYLDLEGLEEAELTGQDAFYELLSAVILGLAENMSSVRVYWYDGNRKRLEEREVSSGVQCRELLLLLYREQREASCKRMRTFGEDNAGGESRAEREIRGIPKQSLRLDGKLRLYWKDGLVFDFSERNPEQQTAGKERRTLEKDEEQTRTE